MNFGELIMDEEIQELIVSGEIVLADLSVAHRGLLTTISDDGNGDKFVEIFNGGEYGGLEAILDRYSEDPLHFELMSGDVDELVLHNSGDADYVKFAIEHYDVNIGWIQEELGDTGDYHSADRMIFDSIIGVHEDDIEDEVGMSGEEEYYEGQ